MLLEQKPITLIWKSPVPWNCAKSTSKAGGKFLAHDRESQKRLGWRAFGEIARRVAKNFKLYSMTEEDRFQECLCAIIVNLERIHAARTNPEGLAYKVAHARLCRLYRKDRKLALIPTSQMGNEEFGDLPSHLALDALMPKDEIVSNFISTERLAAAVEHLHYVMQFLTERELTVIQWAYGFSEDGNELTYEEIGKQMGLSCARIDQIEKAAVQRMRQLFISRN